MTFTLHNSGWHGDKVLRASLPVYCFSWIMTSGYRQKVLQAILQFYSGSEVYDSPKVRNMAYFTPKSSFILLIDYWLWSFQLEKPLLQDSLLQRKASRFFITRPFSIFLYSAGCINYLNWLLTMSTFREIVTYKGISSLQHFFMTICEKCPVVTDMSIYPVLISIGQFINVSHQDSVLISTGDNYYNAIPQCI